MTRKTSQRIPLLPQDSEEVKHSEIKISDWKVYILGRSRNGKTKLPSARVSVRCVWGKKAVHEVICGSSNEDGVQGPASQAQIEAVGAPKPTPLLKYGRRVKKLKSVQGWWITDVSGRLIGKPVCSILKRPVKLSHRKSVAKPLTLFFGPNKAHWKAISHRAGRSELMFNAIYIIMLISFEVCVDKYSILYRLLLHSLYF